MDNPDHEYQQAWREQDKRDAKKQFQHDWCQEAAPASPAAEGGDNADDSQ